MLSPADAASQATEIVGDPRLLTARLGSSALLQRETVELVPQPDLPRTESTLRLFLSDYIDRVLGPQEIPIIIRAYELAERGFARELIELDQKWAATVRERPFPKASLAVGRRQLNRLRPLRDQRVIQRYAAAVDADTAHGWHVIVYGLALAVFGMPLRSGLLHYASQTVGGFVTSAPTSVALTDRQKAALLEVAVATLPDAVQRSFPADPALRLV